ncbi:amino acid permease [Colletotrichum asianum]|uniref:Amino acid permease n=1 Tax=Colletotrichum asianum TaxID=702518 RepID=A0A8H3ZFB7_9PEZI|nr:amino acid permease [Colletotrichum asianum]
MAKTEYEDFQPEVEAKPTSNGRRSSRSGTLHSVAAGDVETLEQLGYEPSNLHRNRSTRTLLFQSFAICSIPYGLGGPLINVIYGGGPLALFVGWIVVALLSQCVALSVAELASRYPTSAGPYYWSFQVASRGKAALSFVTGWTWLIANWTITLSVNFGFASLLAGTITMMEPTWVATSWQLLLIFYGLTIFTAVVVIFCNRWLSTVDAFCSGFIGVTIFVVLIALSVQAKAGRHDAAYALGHYEETFSGWEHFTFFIGLLPSAYVFCAVGMISAMAEECKDPSIRVPKAIGLTVPIQGVAGLFFILPICFTLAPLEQIIASPYGQALPVVFSAAMGTPGGGLGLMILVLIVTIGCSLSITVAASRCTWAFARDNAIPGAHLWSKVDAKLGVPVNAVILVTIVEMLLGLINIGSTSAFTAFVSVGVMALEISYLIPILISLMHGRKEVNGARYTCGPKIGTVVNCIAIAWIFFQTVLFSMPTAMPVTAVSMNYASVVFVGFAVLSAIWYRVHARKVYKGPPATDGIAA